MLLVEKKMKSGIKKKQICGKNIVYDKLENK